MIRCTKSEIILTLRLLADLVVFVFFNTQQFPNKAGITERRRRHGNVPRFIGCLVCVGGQNGLVEWVVGWLLARGWVWVEGGGLRDVVDEMSDE